MKIGVWIMNNYAEEKGGGASFHSRLIKAMDDYTFNTRLDIVFISENIAVKQQLKKEVIMLPNKEEVSINRKSSIARIPFFGKKLTEYYNKKHEKQLSIEKERIAIKQKKILQDNKVDLLLYTVQMFMPLDYPFICFNWDIGHCSTYPFPELAGYETFKYREWWYRTAIHKAINIFTESETGKKELITYLGINPQKIKVVPIFPGDVTQISSKEEGIEWLSNNNLKKEGYFLYPANFHSHKNHYNLILAFEKFLSIHPKIKLVFTGSKRNNLDYILSLINKKELSHSIIHMNFVPKKHLNILYRNALALVMPTFLGPTNMPPLEARLLNCPVICSNLVGHKEMLGEGALYFFPNNVSNILSQLLKITITEERSLLLSKAKEELKKSPFNLPTAIKKLEQYLIEIIPIRKSWS